MSDEDKAVGEWKAATLPQDGEMQFYTQADLERAFRAGWAAGVAAVKVAKVLPTTVRPAWSIVDEEDP